MKHTLTIIALLIGMICNAQDTTGIEFAKWWPYKKGMGGEWVSNDKINYTYFTVHDSTREVMRIDYRRDSAMTVYDSLATIKVLVISINQMQEQVNIKYAAEDILQYIRFDGSITDKHKFTEACTKYLKLKNKSNQ